jgi:hypothetical protein
MKCPLAQQIGCAYGKNLKCPEEYLLCNFYMLYENESVMNDLARIELRANKLEESFVQMELNLREELK